MKMSEKLLLPTILAVGILGSATPLAAQPSSDVAFGSQDPGQRLKGSIDLQAGYDDNVFATDRNEVDSFFTRAVGSLSYRLGTPRTTLSLGLSTSGTYFYDRDEDPWDFYVNGTANFTHDLNDQINIFASTRLTYAVEPDFGSTFTTDRRDGDYFLTNTSLGLQYQWTERFSTVTSGQFTSITYDDSAIGDFYNRLEYGGSQSFRFAVLPDTTAVLEYRLKQINAEDNSRDAFSQYVLAGVDHRFTQRLSGAFRAGAEFRDFEEVGMETSPFFEGSLTYLLPRDASLRWLARYGFEFSDTIGAEERRTFRTTLSYNQRFTASLSGNIGLSYVHSDYETGVGSGDFSDDTFGLSVGLSYAFTRNVALTTSYNFQFAESDLDFRDYTRNRYTIGLQVRF